VTPGNDTTPPKPGALSYFQRHHEKRPSPARILKLPCVERTPDARTQRQEKSAVEVKIVMNDKGNPPGKLADAELHFSSGPLDGLKLIGFAVWERRSGNGRNVTVPARQYSVNGERRSFALLRPMVDATAQDRVRDLILQAYAEVEAQQAVTT
jgi:hypothetical protein